MIFWLCCQQINQLIHKNKTETIGSGTGGGIRSHLDAVGPYGGKHIHTAGFHRRGRLIGARTLSGLALAHLAFVAWTGTECQCLIKTTAEKPGGSSDGKRCSHRHIVNPEKYSPMVACKYVGHLTPAGSKRRTAQITAILRTAIAALHYRPCRRYHRRRRYFERYIRAAFS